MPQLVRKKWLDTGNLLRHDKHTGGAFCFLQWDRYRRQQLADAAHSAWSFVSPSCSWEPFWSPPRTRTAVSEALLSLSSHVGTCGVVWVAESICQSWTPITHHRQLGLAASFSLPWKQVLALAGLSQQQVYPPPGEPPHVWTAELHTQGAGSWSKPQALQEKAQAELCGGSCSPTPWRKTAERRKPKSPTQVQTKFSSLFPADGLPCWLFISSPPNPHQLLGLRKSTSYQTSPASLLQSKMGSHHPSSLSHSSQSHGCLARFLLSEEPTHSVTTEPHTWLASYEGLFVLPLQFPKLANILWITSVRYHRHISSWILHSERRYWFNKWQQVSPKCKKKEWLSEKGQGLIPYVHPSSSLTRELRKGCSEVHCLSLPASEYLGGLSRVSEPLILFA